MSIYILLQEVLTILDNIDIIHSRLCVVHAGPAAVLWWLRQRIPHVLPEASDDPAAWRYNGPSLRLYYTFAVRYYTCHVLYILERLQAKAIHGKVRGRQKISPPLSLPVHRELELSLVSGPAKRQGLCLRRRITPRMFFSTRHNIHILLPIH